MAKKEPFKDGSGLTVKFDGLPDLLEALKLLGKQEVLVGFPEDTTERQSTSTDPEEERGITNASIAYVQDNGQPELNIPARPFMRPGMDDAKPDVIRALANGARAVLAGRGVEGVERGLHGAGLKAQTAIKLRIRSNIQPKLAPRTLAARKKRGVTRENTLVDTAEMLNSVKYVIRNRKDRKK